MNIYNEIFTIWGWSQFSTTTPESNLKYGVVKRWLIKECYKFLQISYGYGKSHDRILKSQVTTMWNTCDFYM